MQDFFDSISNILRYFIQCDPRMPFYWHRWKKPILSLFAIFLIIFLYLELHSKNSEHHSNLHPLDVRWKADDENTAIRAQLGYCKKKLLDVGGKVLDVNDQSMPIIYAITPTYARPQQKAELTRLCYTFLLVPNLHWILIEDSKVKTELVKNFLATECGVKYTHLNVATPPEEKLKAKDPNWLKPRGVHQRNEGLHWLRQHLRNQRSHSGGVLYFADDDNTYSIKLFEEMRHTKRVSVWPVGIVGGLMLEKPKVEWDDQKKLSIVTGWDVAWKPERPFAMDMAGFAVNVRLFLDRPKAKFAYHVRRGYQESEFLSHLNIELTDLEPKADKCTKVYVWHTRSEKPDLKMEKKRQSLLLPPSNMGIIV